MDSETVLPRLMQREDLHQSFSYAKLMERIGWSSIAVSSDRLSVRQLGPVSLAKLQRPLTIHLPKLLELRKRLSIFHLIIEPTLTTNLTTMSGENIALHLTADNDQEIFKKELNRAGLYISSEHYAHSKTMVLDIKMELDVFLKNLPQKTRYNIKQAQKQNVNYDATPFEELTSTFKEEFFILHRRWTKERNIFGYTDHFLSVIFDVFQQNGYLLSARIEGKLVGVMILLLHHGIGYYYYTCTVNPGFKYHVPTGLTFEAIKISKARGCDIFDFCSVYDERYPTHTPRWKGFSEFKSRFDPVSVYYPPSYSRWI